MLMLLFVTLDPADIFRLTIVANRFLVCCLDKNPKDLHEVTRMTVDGNSTFIFWWRRSLGRQGVVRLIRSFYCDLAMVSESFNDCTVLLPMRRSGYSQLYVITL